jgi:hypothetical protein
VSKIYRDSFRFFLASLPALILLGAMIEIAFWLTGSTNETVASGTTLLIAYFFHRHFLFGEQLGLKNNKTAEGSPPQKFGLFLLVAAGLLVLTIVLAAIAGAFSFPPLIFLVVVLSIYLVILSLFGTALPATVARDGTYKLSQGTGAFFQTIWRLLLGPGLVGMVLFVLAILSSFAFDRSGLSDIALANLTLNTVYRTLGFLTTIFAVAVLCDMYRRTRPEPFRPDAAE